MLVSMTGFASKSVQLDFGTSGKASLFIEMKAINARFFEVVTKMPSALNSIETKAIGRLQKILRRGRVYVTIRFADDNEAFEEIVPSLNIARGYINAAKKVKDECGIGGDLAIDHLFQLPNVFVTKKGALTKEQEAQVLSELEAVAHALTDTRKEEGRSLLKDIQERFAICAQRMASVSTFSEEMIVRVKKEIGEKIELVEKGDEVAKIQLDDLYAQLNKIDVHEEITRFNSHLKSVTDLLASDKLDKGKRLDFILQELLRETNTTMAKCTNFDISSVGVDIKVELEKAREQTQNIV